MTVVDIIRAWKDADYWAQLSEAERANLPEHPVGMIELDEVQLTLVAGGNGCTCTCTHHCEPTVSGNTCPEWKCKPTTL
jgi:mersacidin/lichenicidin family type 2 lantibiotic